MSRRKDIGSKYPTREEKSMKKLIAEILISLAFLIPPLAYSLQYFQTEQAVR
jgi:hypothetical protein